MDFCVEQNCFTQAKATTLYDFTIVFDSLDDNYHEFDRQKLLTLYDAIASEILSFGNFSEYHINYTAEMLTEIEKLSD